jgi:excisionase family DNA binding protein
VAVDSITRSSDPAAFVAAAGGELGRGERLRLSVGDASIDVDGALAEGVLRGLLSVIDPLAAELAQLPEEITTGQAADLLRVSRPTVVALVDAGKIPSTRVGTHRRLLAADVLAYREQARRRRSVALDELAAMSEELGLYDE